jgi:small ligand-binding sensory domain FIST
MQRFLVGHATHPRWSGALALAAAQLDSQAAQRRPSAEREGRETQEATLGLVYFSDHYAADAAALHAALRTRWPHVQWVGTVGVGVCAGGVEYFDEPGLVLMLTSVPSARFRVFSGAQRLEAPSMNTALVHADAQAPDLADLLDDLADRTDSGYLFGGLSSSRTRTVQIADGVFEGGLSGVAFTRDVGVVSRVTQGCQPVGPTRRVTECDRNVVIALNDEPAMQQLLADLRIQLDQPRQALQSLRGTLVGLSDPQTARDATAFHRAFGENVRVRHLVGLDPQRQGVAVADTLEPGMNLAFCQRDTAAARRDLVRICAEIRDELSGDGDATPGTTAFDPAQRIAGAVYVSCAGRGGPHFGAPSAELQIVRHALGDVPLVGFFAGGEIAHRHLYGYTGVLTVFVRQRRGAGL